ncbi:lactate utilization protein [Frankia sp. AgPm24]|uniref:LUD domain-containing protein n=1 Tax=Frankia sp. AgPm24 TaxID=631128 RepID=UPI00200F2C54|nr:LUD domain-containing protein [Frankia sp. AgPm24]MCK9925133.1 lactate utilization protein [Frankia sp. AgPm24]
MTVEAPPLDETFSLPADTERLDRAVVALREHGYTVHVVDTVEQARELVGGLLPTDGQSIFTASSETLRVSGILADIDESGTYTSVRASAPPPGEDVYATIRLGATPDVVVGSVHAVTEDGALVVGSASGSQFAPYASGARRAIWVVGSQKIVADVPTALRRIRTYSLPREHQRLNDLYNQGSFLGRYLILEREAFPDRGVVVLIRETIGF